MYLDKTRAVILAHVAEALEELQKKLDDLQSSEEFTDHEIGAYIVLCDSLEDIAVVRMEDDWAEIEPAAEFFARMKKSETTS
jgi:hypothetical protein